MAAPDGWAIEQSAGLNFVPNAEAKNRTLLLAREGNMDIVLDFATGKEIYVGRTTQIRGLTLEEPQT